MLELILQTIASTPLPGMPPVAPAPVAVGAGAEGSISTLPLGVHATAVVGLGAGLLLWTLGGRMVKVAMAVLGMAGGAGIGSMLVPVLGVTAVAGFPAHLVGMTGGAIVGLVAAILLFRFAMVIAGAGVIGAGAALVGRVYVNVAPPPEDLRGPGEVQGIIERDLGEEPSGEAGANGEQDAPSLEETVRDVLEEEAERQARQGLDEQAESAEQGLRSMVSEETAAAVEEGAERIRVFVAKTWRAFVRQWNALDAAQRLVLAGFVVVGLAAGALLGLAMPTKSAAMLTSLAGSAVWLASLAWLAEAMSLPGRHLLVGGDHSSLKWLIVWPVVAVLGLVFQLRNLKQRAERAEPREGRRRGRDGEDDKD